MKSSGYIQCNRVISPDKNIEISFTFALNTLDMSFAELCWAFAHLMEKSFSLFVLAENKMNWTIIGIACIFFVWWCMKEVKYNKEAGMNGTMR